MRKDILAFLLILSCIICCNCKGQPYKDSVSFQIDYPEKNEYPIHWSDLDSSQINYLESIIPGFTARYETISKHKTLFQPDTEETLYAIMSAIENDSCTYFDDLNYFEALKILCMHYFEEGNNMVAEEFLFSKRKFIIESNAATIYNSVFDWMYGLLRTRQGEFDEAVIYLKSAAIGYDSIRANEYEYIMICQNLALAYLSTSNIDAFDLEGKAVVAMTEICDSTRKDFPLELKLFTRRLQALHRIVIDGELDEGVNDLEDLAYNDSLREDFRIAVMTDLADIYIFMDDDLRRYIKTYNKCLELTKDDDFKIQILRRIIGPEWLYADEKEIVKHSVQINNLLKRRAIKQLATLPSTYRKTEWDSIADELSKCMYVLHRFRNDSIICGMCYDNILFIKNKIFMSDRLLRENVYKCKDSERQNLLAHINQLYEHVLYKGIYEPDDALAYAYELAYSEKDLMNALPLEESALSSIQTWKDVQLMLEKDAAAVEIVDIPILLPSDSIYSKLFALILTPQCRYPQCVELGNYYDIIDELRNVYSKDAANINESYLNPNSSLRHLIWDRISPILTGIKTIYISTNTALSRVNIGALILSNGYIASERWDLHMVTSTAEIINVKKRNYTVKDALLIGCGKFDKEKADGILDNNLRSEICRVVGQRGVFGEIPGAVDEVAAIEKLLKQSKIQTKCYIAEEAEESVFRNIDSQSPEVLHIATHFFCIDDSIMQINNPFLSRLMTVNKDEGGLLYTGFILSNANKAWNSKDETINQNDGIVLSADIARMNLSTCELAVMSGCQSGVGQVKYDRVIGLQSALKAAGVKTIMQSLWSVDDKVTKEFMIEFYKALITEKDKHLAFAKTQLAIRKKYHDPYYWAAFIMLD